MNSLNLKKNASSIWPLAIFMVIFYILDALRIYLNLAFIYVDRLVVWTLPMLLFIIFVLHKNPLKYLKLSTNIKKGIFWGIIISAVHALIHVVFHCFRSGNVTVHWTGFHDFYEYVLMAGLIEEPLFRGFALGYLSNIYSFKTANSISSLLFLLAHIAFWISSNKFVIPLPLVLYDFAFIFVFGLLEGFFLRKTNSLWICIIHHTTNNFLAAMVR